ncbi:LANO_0H00254g1_1 [Lachancea nothofagi CBS 11611]|uniref:DNA-directed RNA polymerase III subunit RPC3 n=1 Tax=Lachancea nothofagi CBS 11611 TaxID=1266666 RepID=A0A1G4KKM1_9SACH|nr:LANO_0H00254g1_1 [Lachancea nothofagi CBS 11611]
MATQSVSPEPLGHDEPIVGSVASLEARGTNPESFLYRELCRTHLGERAASIVDILISKGRMSARELQDRSGMDLKSVKRILVSLVQLRCVQYCNETHAPSGRSTIFYYFCEDGMLLLLYAGEIVEAIKELFQADLAAQIVQNVLALGSLTVKAYVSAGLSNDSPTQVSSYFVKLCDAGFLVPLTTTDYSTIGDVWTKLYQKEYSSIPKTSTLSDLKKRTEAKQKAKEQFYKLLRSPDLTTLIVTDPQTSMRKVADTVPLTFNLKRYLKVKRSKQLVQFAAARVGSVPSAIYKVVLQATERYSPEIIDPLTKTGLLQDADEQRAIKDEATLAEEKVHGTNFTATDIAKYLPDSVDLRDTISSQMKRARSGVSESQPAKRIKTEDGFVVPSLPSDALEGNDLDNDNIDLDLDDNDSDPHSLTLINSHLKLLSASTTPFLQESKPGHFYVPYSKLLPMLKSSVYKTLITYTLGPPAARILSCICDNRLASEKVINSTALMKEKDIRSVIAVLIKYNAVEIQEVPRTADRAASRSVFLFRNNEKHAYDFMKKNLTWNIGNLYHKIEDLKNENSTLLKKANRDDVKGKEAELLLPSELNQLKMVNERELNGLTRNQRLLSLWEVFKFF